MLHSIIKFIVLDIYKYIIFVPKKISDFILTKLSYIQYGGNEDIPNQLVASSEYFKLSKWIVENSLRETYAFLQ